MGGVVDMVKSLVGVDTSAEKEAKAAQNEQRRVLQQQQADAQKQLEERQTRMKMAQRGRGSLLSGTETGIEQKPLATTLG